MAHRLETPSRLEEFASTYAKRLEAGTVLILAGVMGAGKTTFVKGLLHGLGSTSSVSSPTYTYIHEYQSPLGLVVHIDAYRLDDAKKLWRMGLSEYLETAFLVVIEWGEGLLEDIPEAKLLKFEVSDEARVIHD